MLYSVSSLYSSLWTLDENDCVQDKIRCQTSIGLTNYQSMGTAAVWRSSGILNKHLASFPPSRILVTMALVAENRHAYKASRSGSPPCSSCSSPAELVAVQCPDSLNCATTDQLTEQCTDQCVVIACSDPDHTEMICEQAGQTRNVSSSATRPPTAWAAMASMHS